MWGGKNDPRLKVAWDQAVATLESGDPKVSHYVFTHWSGPHPRVRDHRAMADELTKWLQAQPWLAAAGSR
jgi:hypothetical protein